MRRIPGLVEPTDANASLVRAIRPDKICGSSLSPTIDAISREGPPSGGPATHGR
jgi:hypothetical protein